MDQWKVREVLPEKSTQRVALYFYRLKGSGGAERMLLKLANALAARGFAALVASWDEPETRSFHPLDPKVTWARLGFRPGLVDKLRRTSALARALRAHRAKVLIGFVMSGDRTIYAAARLAGVRLVAAERNAPAMYYLRYGAVQRWLRFALLHLCDRITVQFAEFVSGYPVSLRSRIVAIPNPVPAAERLARPNTPDIFGRYTLLAVSRLDSVQKRLECLINAFVRIAAAFPDWNLRIIGEGEDGTMLHQCIINSGLKGRIRVEPSTPNINRAYAEAHLFVIPSLWEGFPNALAEAMSHGLPPVGFHDAPGVTELIVDNSSGWLAAGVNDEDSLAQALTLAMSDGAERVRRGRLAIRQMETYSPEVQYDRWAYLLGSLLEKHG